MRMPRAAARMLTMELIAWMLMTKSHFSHSLARWWRASIKWAVESMQSLGRRWAKRRQRNNSTRCLRILRGSGIKSRLWMQKTKSWEHSSSPSPLKRRPIQLFQMLHRGTAPWTTTSFQASKTASKLPLGALAALSSNLQTQISRKLSAPATQSWQVMA